MLNHRNIYHCNIKMTTSRTNNNHRKRPLNLTNSDDHKVLISNRTNIGFDHQLRLSYANSAHYTTLTFGKHSNQLQILHNLSNSSFKVSYMKIFIQYSSYFSQMPFKRRLHIALFVKLFDNQKIQILFSPKGKFWTGQL